MHLLNPSPPLQVPLDVASTTWLQHLVWLMGLVLHVFYICPDSGPRHTVSLLSEQWSVNHGTCHWVAEKLRH